MKLSNSFSGALRTFAYFMSSGNHFMLKGVDYLPLYGKEPSAIEQVYAIFANVLEFEECGSSEHTLHHRAPTRSSLPITTPEAPEITAAPEVSI